MSYTIYIGDDCHECNKVVDYIRSTKLDVSIINIDQEDAQPPIKTYVRPILFKANDLVAYGSDIIRYFEKQ